MRKVVTRTCEIFVDEWGILHVTILKGVIIDKEDAADNFVVIKNLTKGEPALKMVIARDNFKIAKKAQSYVEKENLPDKHIAKAIVVGNVIEQYIQRFFLGLENPHFPVKIFTSEEKALEWLKSFLVATTTEKGTKWGDNGGMLL